MGFRKFGFLFFTLIVYSNRIIPFGSYLQKCFSQLDYVFVLVKKELYQRYLVSVKGWIWGFIQPTLSFLVFVFFFEYVLQTRDPAIPLPLFIFSGLILWYLFTGVFVDASQVLLQNAHIIKNFRILKMHLFFSSAITKWLEILPFFAVYLLLAKYYNQNLLLAIAGFLMFSFPIVLFALGLGIISAIVGLKNKVFLQYLPFIVHFGIWFTPVFYTIDFIPENILFLFYINPLVFFIEGFREFSFDNYGAVGDLFFISSIFSLLIILPAINLLRKYENKIAELV